MAKKPTRLRFTEDDLADKAVRQAADRAEKAVGKAEKAVEKASKPKKKLRTAADVPPSSAAGIPGIPFRNKKTGVLGTQCMCGPDPLSVPAIVPGVFAPSVSVPCHPLPSLPP